MSTRLKSKVLSLLVVMLAATAVLWACGRPSDQVAAPANTPVVASTVTITAATASTAKVVATTATTQTINTSEKTRIFTIDSSKSEARFTLNEVLMGSPKTVVGVTSLITGTITIDSADPTKSTISPLQIDARDLHTDSNMRNSAIRRFVLQTAKDEYRYIVFTPKTIEGLPKAAKAGDAFDVKISGDLTISGVTKPVVFTTNVKAVSDNELSGLAKAQVLRSDFNLNIPNVPSVANVTDQVQLELQFTANAE